MAEKMDLNKIHVKESLKWAGRPVVLAKNLCVIGRKGQNITLDGKWLLGEGSSGTFQDINFVNGKVSTISLVVSIMKWLGNLHYLISMKATERNSTVIFHG